MSLMDLVTQLTLPSRTVKGSQLQKTLSDYPVYISHAVHIMSWPSHFIPIDIYYATVHMISSSYYE